MENTKQSKGADYKTLNRKIDRLEKIALLGAKNALTLDEAAILTGLSKNYLYRLTSSQRIPHYKPNGRTLYFKKDELEAWMLKNPIRTKADIDDDATTFVAINK